MPIVKKLVDLMQGTIAVESQIGKGTKFTVMLPHRIAGINDTNQFTEKIYEYEAGYFMGKRILLAEDNELNVEIAMTILEEAGFEKAGIMIFAMTANAFEEDKKNAYKAGMNGHIAKPIRVEALLSLLADIFHQ